MPQGRDRILGRFDTLGSHAAQIYADFATEHAGLDFSTVIETLR